MGQLRFSPPPWRYEEGARAPCPRCGGPTRRIRRRAADRMWSLLRPVQRYRCHSPPCGWQGNWPVSARERASRPPRTLFVGVGALLAGLVCAAAWAVHETAFSYGSGLLRLIGLGGAS